MGKIKTNPITRVDNMTKERFVNEFLEHGKPVLMGNLSKDWPAYKKWNLDYMKEVGGENVVPLYDSNPTKGNQSSIEPVKRIKLKEYVDILKAGPTDLRMFFYNILSYIPELTKDFNYPEIGLKFFKKLPVLFIGGEGSRVLLHYDVDLANNILFHFHGKKTVVLFAPDQTKYLYKMPWTVHNIEEIDMENPDFEQYPALQKAVGIKAEMNHGDALFIPSGYWHYVIYDTAGFSMALRAFPRQARKIATVLYNLAIMRTVENMMRKLRGQKWLDYKENKVVQTTNEKFKNGTL